MLGGLYGVAGLFEALNRYEQTGDPSAFSLPEQAPYRAVQAYDWPPYRQLFEHAASQIEAYGRGELSLDEATDAIYRLIQDSHLSPRPWGIENPERRYPGTLTLGPIMRLAAWGKYQSPPSVRQHYFVSGRGRDVLKEVLRAARAQLSAASDSITGMARDATRSWNTDWK